VEQTEERSWEAEIYRLKGELLLKAESATRSLGTVEGMQDSESPEGCFLKAIELARLQEGQSLELRATVSLARLWQQHRKQDQARPCWQTSTASSLRASTQLICGRHKLCSKSFQRKAENPITSPIMERACKAFSGGIARMQRLPVVADERYRTLLNVSDAMVYTHRFIYCS